MKRLLAALLSTVLLMACSPEGSDKICMQTSFGEMQFRLSKATPLHRENFLLMIDIGEWEPTEINRIVHNFVVQGGCPDLPDGSIEATHWIPAEFNDSLQHVFGALGMGRNDRPGRESANCQFYIVTHPESLPRLDGEYTIIGQLIDGADVLQQLNEVGKSIEEGESPAIPISISRCN